MRASALATVAAVAAGSMLWGCQEATAPLNAPVPRISAITPDSALQLSGPVHVLVSGSGFHPETLIRFNDEPVVTKYVGTTQVEAIIPASRLRLERNVDVTAATPAPGGGISAPVTFRIVTLDTPVLTSISPESADYGSTGVVLTVTGSDFRPESIVRWNGIEMATTFVSASELHATIQDRWLLEPGIAEVSVHTTIGGAGVSDPAQFVVHPPAAVITLLSSRGATAGRPGFTLTLDGEDFYQGASVRWNGDVRDAVLLAPGRLAVGLSNTDVAQPGSVPVSVINLGGAESEPVTFNIRTLGPATATVARTPLMARDMVWDQGTGLLYASVAADNGVLGNTITAVDPETVTVEKYVLIGSEPNQLALSDNGEYLYVGLDGAAAVRRVELGSFTPGLQWSLGGDVATDIEVAPGRSGLVAVARFAPDLIPGAMGVTIYDDGVARPVSSQGHIAGATRIEFLESPDTLYGSQPGHQHLVTISVDSDGARHVDSAPLLDYVHADIAGAAGRIYGAAGAVADAARNTRLGTAGRADAVAADPATGRLFYLTRDGIAVYDMNTFQHLDTILVPDMNYGDFPRLVRWGADGLAITTGTELIIIRSPIVAP